MTNVLAPSVCAKSTACPIANQARFYNSTKSESTFQVGQTGIVDNVGMDVTVGAISTLTGSVNWMFDTVSIPFLNSVSGNSYRAVLPDFDMLAISSAQESLPDGTTYPAQIGRLGLGAPEFNQSWLHFPPTPRWNGTLLPSFLFGQGSTSSISYGMHIGSPALGIPGSLNIGGYDQSRVLGPVSSQAYTIDHLPIDLLDIGIGVAEGGPPFQFKSKSGLLAAGNSSIGLALSVLVEAPIPYIYLPQSTCDAITSFLPVTYRTEYGLYFWNVDDPQYKLIVSSPAFLSFIFCLNSSISQIMTINIPFALLNLTLTAPITTALTSYFPLRPIPAPGGNYALGRSFLQAAFIGVNWQTALPGNSEGAWFLAQAPGPNAPSQNPTTNIEVADTSVMGSANGWLDSWKGAWAILPETDTTSSNSSSSGSTTSGSSTSISAAAETPGSGRIASSVIAGIAIGVVAILALCAVGGFLLYRRWGREDKEGIRQGTGGDGGAPPSEFNGAVYGEQMMREKYTTSGFGPRELGAGTTPSRPVEKEG